MSSAGLLAHLRARGVVLLAVGDRLVVDAPANTVTPQLRATLVARKSELIALLSAEPSEVAIAAGGIAGDVQQSPSLGVVRPRHGGDPAAAATRTSAPSSPAGRPGAIGKELADFVDALADYCVRIYVEGSLPDAGGTAATTEAHPVDA